MNYRLCPGAILFFPVDLEESTPMSGNAFLVQNIRGGLIETSRLPHGEGREPLSFSRTSISNAVEIIAVGSVILLPADFSKRGDFDYLAGTTCVVDMITHHSIYITVLEGTTPEGYSIPINEFTKVALKHLCHIMKFQGIKRKFFAGIPEHPSQSQLAEVGLSMSQYEVFGLNPEKIFNSRTTRISPDENGLAAWQKILNITPARYGIGTKTGTKVPIAMQLLGDILAEGYSLRVAIGHHQLLIIAEKEGTCKIEKNWRSEYIDGDLCLALGQIQETR